MRPDQEYFHNVYAVQKPLLPKEQEVYDFYQQNPRLRAERDNMLQNILMEKYRSVYGGEAVERDKGVVLRHYKGERVDFNERGELMEFFISESETANWFGGECSIHKASKFDDIKNYTDLVFEWEDEKGERAMLAVDCTISGDEKKLDRKSEGIMANVYRGKLSSLKYHENELSGEKKELLQVPQVLMILGTGEIAELSNIFSGIIKKEPGAKNEFGNSYIQLVLLKEVRYQLDFQLSEILKAIAKRKDDKARISAQKNISRVLSVVKELIKEKESSLDSTVIQRANDEWEKSLYCQYLRGIPLKLNRANWDHV